MQRIYLVWGNSDMTEGRGRDEIKHICSNELVANELAKKSSTMGTAGHVTSTFMYDTVAEMHQQVKDNYIREEALRKLTAEEKRVLGIK
jgi:hypothetical protein